VIDLLSKTEMGAVTVVDEDRKWSGSSASRT